MAASLVAYMQDRGISQTVLAQRTNIGKSVINNYVKGRNGASALNLKRMADVLGVRPSQLLMPYPGQVTVVLTDSAPLVAPERAPEYEVVGLVRELEREEVELPFVPYEAYGTFAGSCHDRNYGSFERRTVKRIAGKDYREAVLIKVRGNSMAPRYPEGSRYVVRPVSSGNWQYAQGVHAISLRNEMFLIKRIISNQAGLMVLSSDSTGEKMSIELGEINCMWKVGEADYMPEEE